MRLFLASCVLLALGADLVAAGPAASASASAPPRDGARRGRGRARGRAAPAQILRDADADADADADVVVAQQAAGPASSPTLATPIFDPTTQDIGDASAFIEDARRRAERIASDEVRDAVNDLYAPILDPRLPGRRRRRRRRFHAPRVLEVAPPRPAKATARPSALPGQSSARASSTRSS